MFLPLHRCFEFSAASEPHGGNRAKYGCDSTIFSTLRHIWRMILTSVGKAIRERREKQGISQAALSALSGFPRRTLTRVEAGDPAVRIGTVERAARALGMSLQLAPAPGARPTLDELDQIYRDRDDDESAADGADPRDQSRRPR